MKEELISYIVDALIRRLTKMSVAELKHIFFRLNAEKDVLIEAKR